MGKLLRRMIEQSFGRWGKRPTFKSPSVKIYSLQLLSVMNEVHQIMVKWWMGTSFISYHSLLAQPKTLSGVPYKIFSEAALHSGQQPHSLKTKRRSGVWRGSTGRALRRDKGHRKPPACGKGPSQGDLLCLAYATLGKMHLNWRFLDWMY